MNRKFLDRLLKRESWASLDDCLDLALLLVLFPVMAFTHVIYIDEAGDEGLGKLRSSSDRTGQSQWLLVGGIIVRTEDDPNLPKWRDEILTRFPKNPSARNGEISTLVGRPAANSAINCPVTAAKVRPRWPWPNAIRNVGWRGERPITGSESGVAGRHPVQRVAPSALRPGISSRAWPSTRSASR